MASPLDNSARHSLDLATWFFSLVALGTFWHGVLLGLTIISVIISIVLGGFRLHDRIKYGAANKRG